jgi:lysozyme
MAFAARLLLWAPAMTTRHVVITAIGIVASLSVAACAADSGDKDTLAATSSELSGCVPVTLKGVDVSYHNDDVDWGKVKASGRSFAFARVSDGLTDLDDHFAKNWPGMKSAGLVRGAYQYFRARHGGEEQADVLLKAIADAGGLKKGDMPPVLDLETDDGQAKATVVARAKAWLQHVESAIGVKPFVYTGNNMDDTNGTNFGAYVLWVPHYEVECPRIPTGWTNWTFWQDSETGSVSGINAGGVDTDFFQGTTSDLAHLTMTHDVALSRAAFSMPSNMGHGGAVMGDGLRGNLDQ